ncbi:protein-glutamate methylesterase/protein-glutamine glutaminase [Lentibacillus cibarius]|uniref:Protein-glutamate methylesterase/protein-glutamine glutaminase n=1 Tax=Lentibacillus cibarius TaxID=2583219 RepID=A0A5S3QSD7_9BACI|nr:chemotaxis response regulator protein-glutamate methylesterase [Lentibacillus cibarius]TMN23596.1 chemotaxis response regulator protein-glutamate methylesterase [Lentibacillus cibarius]
MKPIRVAVIDDSAFMRKMITDILSSDDRLEVVTTATNGKDALKKIHRWRPDVIILDIEMPLMDGVPILREIMTTIPTPVVMLSGVTEKETLKTTQAIAMGAVDFIVKPSASVSLDMETLKEEIITKVAAASQVHVSYKPYTKSHEVTTKRGSGMYSQTIIGIGASTGGPKALQEMLAHVPEGVSSPILIVQHMPAGFTYSLAKRLDTIVDIHVKEAVHGEVIQPSTAYIAPGDYHMKVRHSGMKHVIELTREHVRHGHRPSVDILFESMARLSNINKIAVVLTGMGSDGSNGIYALKKNDPNVVVLAESESSATIYGMPKAAMETGYVDHIASVKEMGKCIASVMKT